ncbi:hypothetical protein DFAR_1260042 [Desulfarculales bacterium]
MNWRGCCGPNAPSGGKSHSSNRTRLLRSTTLGWVRLYRQGGGKLESLSPMGRNDQCSSRALDEDTAQALVSLRRELPTASVTILVSPMMRRRLTSGST